MFNIQDMCHLHNCLSQLVNEFTNLIISKTSIHLSISLSIGHASPLINYILIQLSDNCRPIARTYSKQTME